MRFKGKVTIGNCTLYLADCADVIPSIDTVDLVFADPPYGQSQNGDTVCVTGNRPSKVRQANGRVINVDRKPRRPIIGDDQPFDPESLLAINAKDYLIWGAHKFADRLPEGSWLVWDKMPNGKVKHQGCGEAAWTSLRQPMRIYRLLWDGLCVGSAARTEVTAGQKRLHPAQKPVALMVWCLSFFPCVQSIFDPYMGVGSIGLAAMKLGISYTGVEIDPHYFDIAVDRLRRAHRQPTLFELLDPVPTEMTDLFAGGS